MNWSDKFFSQPAHRPIFTGIGSRYGAPHVILRLAEEIAYVLCKRGYDFRSGRAVGMDEAFERGAARYEQESGQVVREIWLPEKGFRATGHFDPRHGYVPTDDQFRHAGRLLVRTGVCKTFFQEAPNIQRLFGRNVFEIIGEQDGGIEPSTFSEFVVYWAPEENKRVKGGTRIAVYLARQLGITCYNLAIETEREAIITKLGLYPFYKALEEESWGPRVDVPMFT